MTPMTASRLCLIVSAILFVIAALLALDVVHGGPNVTGLALLGFAFWAGSGAL